MEPSHTRHPGIIDLQSTIAIELGTLRQEWNNFFADAAKTIALEMD